MKKTIIYLATVAVLSLSGSAAAQGTAFTYQGQLNNGGNPANGVYDLRFAVFDAATAGAQQGNAITNPAVSVSNGLFTVILDFGNQFPGANRWLDIGVRTNGGGAFTPLTSRQPITSTPYAITSANAAQASSVSATNVTGTLPDARLSTNVALRSSGNAFTGNQTIASGSVGIGTLTPGELLDVNGNIRVADTAVIGGRQQNLAGGILTIQAAGNTSSHGAGFSGGELRLKAGNANISGSPTLGTSFGNDVVVQAGDNVFAGIGNVQFNGNIRFLAGDSSPERMRIVGDNGSVGIGTTSPGLNSLQINPTFHGANGYGLQVNKTDFGANIQINRPAGLGGIGLAVDNSANGDANTSMLLVRNNAGGSPQTLMDVRTSGVAIGNTTPGFPLNFNTVLGDKISLWGNSGNHYGFGIQANLLQIYADSAVSDVAFGWGQSTNFTETMRVKGNGNVGIGTTTPGRFLQIGGLNKEGLMRLASTSTNGASRVWDVGVPLNDLSTAGKYYSFIIDDTGTAIPEFLIRWDTGFVGIGKTNPATRLDVAGEITSTAINLTSDRNEKEGFTAVDSRAVLDKVTRLPISIWRYKSQTDARHIGPVAQDFYEAFGFGRDDKHITSVDADGVALAAIKGLNEKLEQQAREKDQRIADLENEMRRLKEMMTRLATEKSMGARQ
jgi:hypothetical protein